MISRDVAVASSCEGTGEDIAGRLLESVVAAHFAGILVDGIGISVVSL